MQKKLKNKINEFEQLQEITRGDRSIEVKKFYEAALRYGIVKGEIYE